MRTSKRQYCSNTYALRAPLFQNSCTSMATVVEHDVDSSSRTADTCIDSIDADEIKEASINNDTPILAGDVAGQVLKEMADFDAIATEVAKSGQSRLDQFESKDVQSKQFEEMLRDGKDQPIRTGSALSQRIMRALTPAEKVEYDALGKKHDKKSEWRRKWAATRYEQILNEKTKTETWSITDTSVGTYMSFSKIIDEEGHRDNIGDVKAAQNYVLACAAMAGRWVSWNVMTRRYDYLYIRKGSREEFNKSWSLLEKMVTDRRVSALPAASPSGPTPEKVTLPKLFETSKDSETAAASTAGEASPQQSKRDKNASKAAGTRTRGGTNEAAANQPKRAKSGEGRQPQPASKAKAVKKGTEFNDAESLRSLIMGSKGRAAYLLESVNSDPLWKWAQTDDMRGALAALKEQVDSKVKELDDVGKSFVSGCNVKSLFDQFGENETRASVAKFVTVLQGPAEKLNDHMTTMSAMHSIRSRGK